MILVMALILAPMAVGLCLLFLPGERVRRIVVVAAIVGVVYGVLALAARPAPADWAGASLHSNWIHAGMTTAEVILSLYVLYVGVRSRRPLIVALIVAQSLVMGWFEWTAGSKLETAQNLFVDGFAVIMALINGLVGGGICLYALGYMRDYHGGSHPEVADRRPWFFALLFVFMGAMFGLVFANNLVWLFLFWEITTLCSFFLIGYSRTPEAERNALLALAMNLAGGLAFALAIVWFHHRSGSVELAALIASPKSVALLPAALLCFAGITKAAQLPFSNWLLGAMVAPTPVSALLHSSTMVKAGVYLILRVAPVITATRVGLLVALVGGITFLAGSLAAITVSDAKRVLAYSTVANLGLIVLCGGIGTAAAVWAGVLLIVFHAVAKCLLFLCVGVVEHKVHSRDIEGMSGLIGRMPQVAAMMLIGMAGMFLAPFGMLISKWAVLKAVVDASPLLSVFVVFGSAATLFFWVKWMGKVLEVIEPGARFKGELVLGESVALYGLTIATLLACLLFPLISSRFIVPYVAGVYGQAASLGQGNVLIMVIMTALVMLFPLSFIPRARGPRVADTYLGGANTGRGGRFLGSGNEVQAVALNNYYLRGFFSEAWLSLWGILSCAALLVAMLILACV
jgi:ech hydrogenase subunit A